MSLRTMGDLTPFWLFLLVVVGLIALILELPADFAPRWRVGTPEELEDL